ncbi:MAG: hypothetical protein H7841_11180 [Magnetospirillum sp. WYHS-4]
MEQYVYAGTFALLLTGWALVSSDRALPPIDRPPYVHRPGMRYLTMALWPVFKPLGIITFVVPFSLCLGLHSLVAEWIEARFWRGIVTGAIFFPVRI